MSLKSSGIILGPSSVGSPNPLKILPSIFFETGTSNPLPVNLTLASLGSIPIEGSYSSINALSSSATITCPLLFSPLFKVISTSSLYLTSFTFCITINGPAISLVVKYSLDIYLTSSLLFSFNEEKSLSIFSKSSSKYLRSLSLMYLALAISTLTSRLIILSSSIPSSKALFPSS